MTADRHDSSRLFQALDREIQRRGRGTAAQLSKRLGFSPGWWADCRRRGSVPMHHFEHAVETLGLNMSAFVCDLYGEPTLHQPRGTPPELVKIAWRRELEQDNTGSLGPSFVEEIDARRHDDSQGVLDLSRCSIRQVRRDCLPLLLAAAGYAHLQLLQLDDAIHALSCALALARKQKIPTRLYLSRLTALYLHLEDYRTAERLADQVIKAGLAEGDFNGVVVGLLDSSTIAYWRQDHLRGLSLLESAAALLENGEPRLNFIISHTRALHLEKLGRLSEAVEAACVAARGGARLPQSYCMKAEWLRSRLLSALDQPLEGAAVLDQVARYYESNNPGEATYAICDLVGFYLKANDTRAAVEATERLRPLIEPASQFPPIAEAIRSILAVGDALSLQTIARARAALHEAQRRRKRSQLGSFSPLRGL